MKRQVSLNNNSFDRAGITKDCKDGVCEYIWNGFEAGASKVSVALKGTPLQEAMALRECHMRALMIPFVPFYPLQRTILQFASNHSPIKAKEDFHI